MPTNTGRFNPGRIRVRMLDDNWPDNADDTDGTVVIAPSTFTFSGVSAAMNGNGFITFTDVTELTLSGVFSSIYDDYIMNIVTTSSTTSSANIRFRYMSGTSLSANNYVRQYLQANGSSINAARQSSQDGGYICGLSSGNGTWSNTGTTVYFYNPFVSGISISRAVSSDASSNATLLDDITCHGVNSSYNGLYIYTSSGLISGTVSMFGLRK